MSVPFPIVVAALKDRYAVERELGRGGMATVFLAEDRRHGRRVAIKVLHPDLTASLGAERFLREIRIAARLAHPHILPLIDSGEAGGVLYYVAPYVPDGSLRDRLGRERRLAVADALRITRELGTALDYAHREGFVHRDVKPENILFADGLAVLADFGIARAHHSATGDSLTEIGLTLGTPDYMSPEQAAGEQQLGSASDLYSMACVTYETLVGEPPLRGTGARATMAKQVTETPRPVRVLRPDAPIHVERALERALAKEPDRRFASLAEFVAALHGEGPEGAPPPVSRSVAVLPFVNASAEPDTEYLSDGVTDELIDALARVEGLRVASRTSVFALKGKAQDVRGIGALLGVGWVLEGTVRHQGPRLRITAQLTSTTDGQLQWSQRFDRTHEDAFAIQEEIARTIVDRLRATSFAELGAPLPRRHTPSAAAYALYLQGRFAWNRRTTEGVTEAMRLFEQAIAADPAYPQAYAGLADAYALNLDYRSVPVAEGFARAKEFARKALALEDGVAEAHASLAWSLFVHDWEWEASGREFRRAVELDPQYATARQWYAFWLCVHGRFDEALAEARRAQELDPSSVSIRRSVGWVYYYARRYDQARHHLARAITMNPTADETYRVLTLAHAMQDQWEDAERAIGQAIALSNGSTYNRATLAYVYARTGRESQAREVLADLERLLGRIYVSPVSFATVHLGLGDSERALDWTERAYEERRGWLAYLTVNPIVDPLRGHPRFEALVAKMRFLPASAT